MDKLTLPNSLSLSRLILAVPSFICVYRGYWLFAAIVMSLAVASDMLDGHLARRRGQVSSLGGLLDHASDAVFVTATLAALALSAVVPLVLPVLVAIAFIQYALDSRSLSGRPLRASRLGRYNGIAYYVLAGFPSMQHALAIYLLPETWFMWIGWVLTISTLASITDRFLSRRR